MSQIRFTTGRLILAALFALSVAWANAEVAEIRVARTVGIGDLPFMVMQDRQLVEKHAKALGSNAIEVSAVAGGGGTVVLDALLSGAAHFAIMGTPRR